MKYNSSQKGSTVLWIVAVVIIAVAVYIVVSNSNKTPAGSVIDQATSTVTIMVPSDLAAFEKAEIAKVQVGGPDPVASTTFVATTTTPNTIVADPLQNAAEAAAEYIPTQAGTSSLVVYFKVVDGTAYVVLNMDVDGWAGVSAAIAQVHPIVEKTLLAQPGIKEVKFGPAPGDTIDSVTQNQRSRSGDTDTSDWKTYLDEQYSFSIKYPSTWMTKGGSSSDLGGFYNVPFSLSKADLPLMILQIYPNQTTIDKFVKYFQLDNARWSDITVNGMSAKMMTNVSDNRGITLIAFIRGTNGYLVSSTAAGQYSYFVKPMAESFKFTN